MTQVIDSEWSRRPGSNRRPSDYKTNQSPCPDANPLTSGESNQCAAHQNAPKTTSPGKAAGEDKTITLAELYAEGERRFGSDRMTWRFVCPGCGHVQTPEDWRGAGAPETAVAFSCVGRWIPGSRDWLKGSGPGPCNYTTGGLFCISPMVVEIDGVKCRFFAFAEAASPVAPRDLPPPAPVSPVTAYASCKSCGDHAELDSDGLCEDCEPGTEL